MVKASKLGRVLSNREGKIIVLGTLLLNSEVPWVMLLHVKAEEPVWGSRPL